MKAYVLCPMRLSVAFFFVMLVGFSCKDEKLVGELIEYTPQQFDIPAGLNNTRAYVFIIPSVSTEHSRIETLTNTPWEDWDRIEPARASLTINESGLNWDFLLEVSVRAYAGDDPVQAKEIFYRDLIPADIGNRIDLIPTDFDANQGILDAEEITIEVELTRLVSSPPQSLPVIFNYSFEGFK